MTTALVDGDVVCYRACEDRNARRIANTNELRDVFGQYDKLIFLTGEEDFTDEENHQYLMKTYEVLKRILDEIKESVFADTIKVAVGGKGNYRKDIYPEYKMNRHADTARRNPFVPILRTMAVEDGYAVAADGIEADDLVRIWAEECRAADEPFVIFSIDKDLKMIPGRHYLMHREEFFDSTPEYAMRFYYEQLLQGDPTDNIQGVPGIGPIKAKELLAKCTTEDEFQLVVMQTFYSNVHQWRYALQLTGQLIYLKKHKDDWFDMSNWPTITLEDIVNKPKKSKKPMDEWDLDSALAAINPFSVTTRARWENAMMYLIELSPEMSTTLSDAVDTLMERDKVPIPEKEAYERIAKYLKRNVVIPQGAPTVPLNTPPPLKVTPPPPLPEFKPPPVMNVPALPAAVIAAVTKPEPPKTPLSVPLFNPALLKKK